MQTTVAWGLIKVMNRVLSSFRVILRKGGCFSCETKRRVYKNAASPEGSDRA